MLEQFPRLRAPLALGGMNLRNRISMTAHATNLAVDGVPGAAARAYFARRARGGAALLVSEGMAVHPTGVAGATTWRAYAPSIVPPLAALSVAVHAEGAVLIGQLRHNGRQMKSQPGGPPLWAASAVASGFFREIPHAITLAEIDEVTRGFVVSAHHVLDAGLDGVEINAAHGFLLHGFLSPRANLRTDDAYGGSEPNRWRLLLEVCAAVRKAIGPGPALGVRLSVEDHSPGGLDWRMVARLARALGESGDATYLSLSHSDFEPWSMGSMVPDARAGVPDLAAIGEIRRSVAGLPVIAAGGIRDPQMAEKLLADGTADLIGMTRALLAEPDLPRLIADGQTSRARPCIACNDCWATVGKGGPIRCTVAPGTDPGLSSAAGQHVVVVGGGAAGLFAARAAVLRGCRVTLVEARSSLTGDIAADDPLHALVSWLSNELVRPGVVVQLATVASPETVRALAPDAVILAVGAHDPQPVDVTAHACVVVDRNHALEALRVAEDLARSGANVTLVTEQIALGSDAPAISLFPALARLRVSGVTVLTAQRVLDWQNGKVSLEDVLTGARSALEAIDAVRIVGDRTSRASEWPEPGWQGPIPLVAVGDCVAPRTLAHAIHDGHVAGRDMPMPPSG